MGGKWKKEKFSELCTITRGGSPRPIHNYIMDKGIPWVKIADATASNSRTINSTKEYIKSTGKQKSREVFPGDLILSNSATPGLPKFMGIYACIHDGWLLLRDFNGLHKEFCYYFLLHERENLVSQGNGSVFTNLKTDILKNHVVDVPTLSEQRAIAHILGTLDDKIELNRQMAQTLESIARAIFKSWFVDFDPVKAKMEGKQPEGMTEEIAALFPDRLVDSELGMIPEGWEYKALGDMINIFDSKRIPLSRSQRKARQGKYPYYGATSIMDYVDDYIFDGVYVLIGEDGSVKKPDGTPFLQYVSGKIWVNNHAHVIQGKRLVTSEYIYLFLSRFNIGPFITGAVQPKLNQGNLKLIPIISPDDKIMELFNETISIVFKKIICLQKECKTLQGLRDTLLPQLISGKIRVNQPEDAAA